ncbi:caspase-8-like isoform X3 [Carcharodon carcharias]|uniref:caspase-8-like isoform X3 n=1 Tax=Carcharodon carcharias TaxID=13397 RepID=UPI001B7F68E8|nr:caspase-8-like isoform X3 [Carcharodon carcharias]
MATNANNFNSLTLHKISGELDEEEVRDLRFLCTDYIPAGKGIVTALEIFTELQQRELDVIPELLYRIQRFKLLSILGKQKTYMEQLLQQPGNSKISNYRVLLYNLSKEIDDKELNSIKFILQGSKKKYQDIKNFMEICIDLEKKEQLAPNNLQILLKAMKEIKRFDLKSKLESYQNMTWDTQVTLPQQESRRQPKEPNQGMFPTVSCPAQADAKSNVSAGTESHQEIQQAPSTADDSAVERPNLQQAGGSTTEKNVYAMTKLHGAMEAIQMGSTPETSKTSILDAASALPANSLTQTGSNSEANQRSSQCIGVYKMNSKPLGICLILNNKSFPGTHFKERNGTDCDAEKLTQVFTTLGFKIDRQDNLTVKHMKKKLQMYQEFNHTTNDCFVCCILSHEDSTCLQF